MSKHLVIVESPAKAKTINKYLGKEYMVKASMGHVRDLVKKDLGVDLENNFQPQYVNSRDKATVIKELKAAAKKSEDVILALDRDREGEAIAWHLRELLKKDVGGEDCFSRVTYNQITKPAILDAFAAPGKLDMNKVDAQQARRVLDRLVGYQVSPLLWKRIRGGLSAGRVQTVALRLVCEREKEILAFVSHNYWVFGARVAKQVEPREPFEIRLHSVDGEKAEILDADFAAALRRDLETCALAVAEIKTKEVKRRPKPPFITSTLQQVASGAFGFPPKRTMSLAQKLYEGVDLGGGRGSAGLITYMRTDSLYLAADAVKDTRAVIGKTYGEEYVPDKPVSYPSRSGAQEAHEAIRPTDPARTPESLRGILGEAEWKLYSLIWKRTIACQMAPARIKQTTVSIEGSGEAHSYLFRANASKVIFPGYMAAWERGLGEEEEEGDSSLPPLQKGEALDVLEWLEEEKETQPPKRFSEAALIKALEENGVGRPSTYASIITTLYEREYVEREKRSLRPTASGMEVNDFLVGRLPELFAVDFTARMEEKLDRVEEGRYPWTEMMGDFYGSFKGWLEDAGKEQIDGATLEVLLRLAAEIKHYNPPVKRGKRTYDDRTFIEELHKVKEDGDSVTERQADHLRRVVARYHEQIDSLTEKKVEELNLAALIEEEILNNRPADETTLRKLQMLEEVAFEPGRKVGRKTYDDAAFVASLREQVDGGRRLSDNQVVYLDRHVYKYADQIEGFAQRAAEAGLSADIEEDKVSQSLLALLDHVQAYREPVTRGGNTWDDAAFAASLRSQFASRKTLTPRQINALKKMLAGYHEQIPDYSEKQHELGLLAPGAAARAGRKKGAGLSGSGRKKK